MAHGTAYPKVDSSSIVHGIPLGSNIKVTVDVAVKPKEPLPMHIRDDLIIVSHAIGSFVPWPRELIILPSDEVILYLNYK